jgi:hypothetical protein
MEIRNRGEAVAPIHTRSGETDQSGFWDTLVALKTTGLRALVFPSCLLTAFSN